MSQAGHCKRKGGALTLALVLLARCGSFEPVCEPISAAKLEQISAGLAAGAGLVLRDAVTVARTSTGDWHFVTAKLDGPGLEGDGHEATWIVSSLEPNAGAVLAVDSTANKYSRWADAGATEVSASIGGAAAQTSRSCLRRAQ